MERVLQFHLLIMIITDNDYISCTWNMSVSYIYFLKQNLEWLYKQVKVQELDSFVDVV